MRPMHRSSLFSSLSLPILLIVGTLRAQSGVDVQIVKVEPQPFCSQIKRLLDALEYLGEPMSQTDREQILKLCDPPTDASPAGIQKILDSKVLIVTTINPESRVKSNRGPAKAELIQQGWSNFLVKVINQGGVTAKLRADSPNALPMYRQDKGSRSSPKMEITPKDIPDRFLSIESFNEQPLTPGLSGLDVEYRIVQLYCRDVGKREAILRFDVGQGTQELGFKDEVPILFDAKPAVEVGLKILDENGEPSTASLLIRDRRGRVYPSQARRLAPDFFFHPQIYRHDGETVILPPGKYTVESTRGPEYRVEKTTLDVPQTGPFNTVIRLNRWIEPKRFRWFSGDHHVHAAGCAHYDNPTQGVEPSDMFRHALGEDLNVSCVLSWGPCWYHQKQFFSGSTDALSKKNYLMRYDVEVSGFPSAHAGHLCLLNLKEDDYEYPEKVKFDWSYDGQKGTFEGTKTSLIGEWPSWDLPILKWGKQQGGVVGFSHSGWGLQVKTEQIPNYEIPPFDGIGANEYIVDVVHDVCDFISAVDTPPHLELNIWYHTLNCGFRCKLSGETDFPCIYGERVGLGRGYVKVDGELDYAKWIAGIKAGRSYVSDGLSHLIDFTVDGQGPGEKTGQLDLAGPKAVRVTAKVAALLGERPPADMQEIFPTKRQGQPYWHVERSRIGKTRTAPVELIVNGKAVARKEIIADGTMTDVEFETKLDHSSWVALRILPSSHTNPVFVHVADKPIRSSRLSADWCIKSVDQCWKTKSKQIRRHELSAAKAAYDHARDVYQQIHNEAVTD